MLKQLTIPDGFDLGAFVTGVQGRLIGSFVIVILLIVAASFLSFLAFQNVDEGFRELRSESLPQLDRSLALARFASVATRKVEAHH